MTLLRVQARHFTAGVVIRDGCVTVAAPILRYMLGWAEGRVWEYAEHKGWHVEEV